MYIEAPQGILLADTPRHYPPAPYLSRPVMAALGHVVGATSLEVEGGILILQMYSSIFTMQCLGSAGIISDLNLDVKDCFISCQEVAFSLKRIHHTVTRPSGCSRRSTRIFYGPERCWLQPLRVSRDLISPTFIKPGRKSCQILWSRVLWSLSNTHQLLGYCPHRECPCPHHLISFIIRWTRVVLVLPWYLPITL